MTCVNPTLISPQAEREEDATERVPEASSCRPVSKALDKIFPKLYYNCK